MKKSPLKLVFYIMLSVCLAGFLKIFASENNNTPVIYKYQYNNIPLKQPTITKSMQPAVAKYKQGDYLAAMIDLEEVVKKEENNTYAKYYLALSYQQLGYKNEAQQLYQEIIDSNENYSLARYSTIAITCIDNPDNEICLPPKKNVAPKAQQQTAQVQKEEAPKEALDDISQFILSGKQIHPAAMDKIVNERMQRKIQADLYSQQQMLNENQPQTSPRRRNRRNTENIAD